MKRVGVTLLIMLTVMFASTAQNYKNVDASTFNNLVQNGNGLLLDVRTPGEYSRGHIEGSTLISVADKSAAQKINMLQKDKPVYVYCLTGSRSNAVARYMSENGFSEVYNLQRGIVEWHQLGLPIVQSNTVAESKSKTYTPNDIHQLLSSKTIVLLNFHAPWCAPCKKMAPDIEKLKNKYQGKATVAKIDIDANKTIQSKYNVTSIPGLVLYKNGQEVWRHTGTIEFEELVRLLESNI